MFIYNKNGDHHLMLHICDFRGNVVQMVGTAVSMDTPVMPHQPPAENCRSSEDHKDTL